MRAYLPLLQHCKHCGRAIRLDPRTGGERTSPPVRIETNGLGESIAWCVCPHCRKITSLVAR